MDSNIENSLDLFSHSQKIKYFATLFCCPRGTPLPCGSCSCPPEPWQSSASSGTSPAAQLCREGDTAARLPPLPGAAGAEHVDLSPVKWEGNHIRKKEVCHTLQKEEREIKWACDWDSLMLTQAGLPGANPVLKMSCINPDD